MKIPAYPYCLIIVCLLIAAVNPASAQIKIKGTVYDSSHNFTIEAVSVLSTSGRGTITNPNGEYEIEVSDNDSIWFSFLNKPTRKFPVAGITTPFAFDISLQINVTVLKEVKVRPRNYRLDSIQNRRDYAKVFDYERPKLRPSVSGLGVGFDLDEIINMFRFRRNKSMLAFQKRLIQQEHDKFVDHKFNKAVVRRLTQLDSRELDSFMLVFRPPYEFALLTSDYEFQEYIKESYRRYINGLPPIPMLREQNDDNR